LGKRKNKRFRPHYKSFFKKCAAARQERSIVALQQQSKDAPRRFRAGPRVFFDI